MAKERKGGEVDGNAMASAAAVQRQLLRMGDVLVRMEHTLEKAYENEVDVKRISVTMPDMERGDYMVYVSAYVDGKKMVAFHGGATFSEAIVGAIDRLANRSLKWREDKYQ